MHLEMRLETGSVAFDQTGAEPLGYEALEKEAGQDDSCAFDITLYGENAVLNGVRQDGVARVKTKVTFDAKTSVYALVEGGWLPLPLVVPPNLLVDRNVVATLKTIRRSVERADIAGANFWLRFLNSPEVYINPVLCAFEGATRSMPNFAEFEREFHAAKVEIESAFPSARVPHLDQAGLGAAYQLVLEVQERAKREREFLVTAVPLLLNRAADRALTAIDLELHSARERYSIPANSLVFLAALACLYEDSSGTSPIGRKLIKPRLGYDRGDAYNAVADLRHLEFLIQAYSSQRVGKFAVCTRDRALALFWSGIAPREFSVEGAFSTFRVTLEPRLFARMDLAATKRITEDWTFE